MKKIAIFMADGCEEIEGLTVVDLLRRAQIAVDMISIGEDKRVTGAHNIRFEADYQAKDMDADAYDGIVLPGGMPGTTHLMQDAFVCQQVKEYDRQGKLVAAICAAPSVLGQCRILQGKDATCYPGFEEQLEGANVKADAVVTSGNTITANGMGAAIGFALAIITYLCGEEAARKIQEGILYRA